MAVLLGRCLLHPLGGRILATLFYEPSTRTRFSFEAAMQKLGGGVLTAENMRESSSAVKGETISDTVVSFRARSGKPFLEKPFEFDALTALLEQMP